ncbi:MAG: phosphate acyltransferase PlsX [Candidatus Omnitrophica bacterium]|nr:phosphate acyltransferase PlsX [Candidatus Omnitrophota bacterium]
MKIVVDAMGGDFAPRVVVEGVVQAVSEFGVDVILVGDEPQIATFLKKQKYDPARITVRHASEKIEMDDSPATSVRRKKDSSMTVGVRLVKEGAGDAFFSAGNTGAEVCAATLMLGLLPGVERPGIATVMPSLKGTFLMIDVGANIDPKPIHLLQYAVMASVYSSLILGKANPTVGLLNVGEEESKGTDFIKETHDMLSRSHLNFIGNVEGKHLYSGECDVIVCDGYVGNVALKVSESLAEAMQKFLKREFMSNPFSAFVASLLKPSFRRFKKEIDYSEYGGAPLLGVNGVAIIGHGRSNANAIKNAIRVAKEEVDRQFNEKILEAINLESIRSEAAHNSSPAT